MSFWLPGQYASFSAVPSTPGWTFSLAPYHAFSDAGAQKSFVTGGNLVAGMQATADLLFLIPSYAFVTPVAGGQAGIALTWGAGRTRVRADANLSTGAGPGVSVSRTDVVEGGSDLYPTASLKWNAGNNNTMVYVSGDIPTGAYRLGRLANIGINHYAIDGGGGYTYLDATTGREFSVVGGVTYNFENHDTHYRNGVDGHVDLALSQFLNEQLLIGVVGYAYQQLSGDTGSGARLGAFESRVFAAGAEAGYFFPVGREKGYASIRGYYEFGAQNRLEGWNAWLTVSIPLANRSIPGEAMP